MRNGVSVWIPNRNHAEYIGTAIYSASREAPLEILILDDNSADNSLEVIGQACDTYNNCRYIQYKTKSECWQKAACPHILSLKGQHIISLSADDELCCGCILSAMRYSDAPIIFHSYAVRKVNKTPHEVIKSYSNNEIALNKDEICQIFLSNINPIETGVGSCIRYDWQKWLIDHEYYKMGPYSDSMGFSAVAALAGAVYVPIIGAIFTQNENSYGSINMRPEKKEYFKQEVIDFFNRINMREDIAKSLMQKRGIL